MNDLLWLLCDHVADGLRHCPGHHEGDIVAFVAFSAFGIFSLGSSKWLQHIFGNEFAILDDISTCIMIKNQETVEFVAFFLKCLLSNDLST